MADSTKILDNIHIYLLDDDEAVCESLAAIFELHGAKVQTFYSLSETRNATLDGQPGILVFDIQLSDGLGHELLIELRCRGIALPAILMSGRSQIKDSLSSRELQEIFVEKPVDGDALAVRIAAVLAASEAGLK